ncbi:hypothetical protein KKA69_04420 [Patescibacteria group bacterium]|nr:hypothetical protein [Patescibacteria group bacterium]
MKGEFYMGFNELLENIKLVDLQMKVKDFLKGKNVGLINITIENKIYNITLPNTEPWKDFSATPITPEIEKRAREISEKKLECISSTFDLLPREVALNIASATMATATLEISLSDHIVMSDHIELKINN